MKEQWTGSPAQMQRAMFILGACAGFAVGSVMTMIWWVTFIYLTYEK